MPSFSHLGIKIKLALLVLVPLLGLLYFSISSTAEKFASSREMGRLEALVSLSVKIGALAHELQKERGMTAGFLGSNGIKFANELPAQRNEADKKINELKQAWANFDATRFDLSLKNQMDEVLRDAGELGAKRNAVSAQSILAPEAVGYYTKMIGRFLNVPNQTSTLSSNSQIARLASAYAALLQSKEQAGQERAILTGALVADKFAPGVFARFLSISAAQEIYIKVFDTYALGEQKEFYKGKISGAAVDEVASIKKSAVEKAHEKNLGIDSGHWFKMASEKINLLKEVEDKLSGDLLKTTGQLKSQAQAMMLFYIMISAATLLITLVFAIYMIRVLLRQLGGEPDHAAQIALSIASGKLDNVIEVKQKDATSLMAALKNMQQQLLDRITAERKVADENLRIKIGLDNVSTSVMISDTERNIIYMNKAVHELMQTAESDLRKELPNFNAATLLGSSIDQFHKNPEHQKSMLASLSSTHRKQIEVGGRTFALAANPVINERGTRLGTALEWQDRTTEVAVEKEVAGIVEAAVNGDFTERIGLQGKEGFFKQLAEGINKLMETSDRGLQEVVRMLGSLARGDLTDHITNEYAGTFGQLKDDANATSAQLKEIIGQIKDATDTINTAAKEIAAGNNDLSQRTEEQASSLEETASSMEELTSTVKQNAENAKQANQLAIGASDIASKGGSVVGQVVTTMDSINESSRKIVDIISVIDGIAFQTNILALNAAVEAARAGEQGRGFAVVAGEVRNLAQRSAAAAKEIKTLIGDSVEKVEGGSKLVAQAGQTMEEIVTAIKRVTDIMSEITAASQEQSQGIEQVNTAITQMDEVTQQNAALVEEAAAAAESLEEQAQNLAVSVGTFKTDDKAGSTAVARRETAPVARAPARKGTAVAKAAPGKAAAVKPKAKPGGDDDGEWEEF
ncbi:MAG: methyl-accepting chemotaxis protein [Gallionella sp.]|nr:methyl-accepting chemotaxis protein [Gallionella sp.]